VAITTQPSPQVQPAGGNATFAVAASGSGPLGYQWLKDGQPLAGQTAAVLNLSALNGSDAGSYSVTVSNALGPVSSNAAVLTVLGTPAITGQPQAATQSAGSTATFSVTANGQGLRYLWLRNGIPVSGATAAQLTTPVLDIADSGAVYSVLVFNTAGVAVSNLAILTVTPVVVTPILPANALTATQVVAANNNSLVVRPDGSVWAFGPNVDRVTGGRLNGGFGANRPVRVAGLPPAQQAAMGSFENFWALGRDGTVSGWGFINDVKGFAQGPANQAVVFRPRCRC
jgi:hypothetical protein